jgi:hypothetical protein
MDSASSLRDDTILRVYAETIPLANAESPGNVFFLSRMIIEKTPWLAL